MFNLEETACRFIKSYVAAGLPGAQGAVAGILGLVKCRGIDGNSRQVTHALIGISYLNAEPSLVIEGEHDMVSDVLGAVDDGDARRIGIAAVIHVDVIDE